MQDMSYGLTQYDVEEVINYCGGVCKSVFVVLRLRLRALFVAMLGLPAPKALLTSVHEFVVRILLLT